MATSKTKVGVIGKTPYYSGSDLGNNNAAFHNSVYRGKNITSYLTDGSLWSRINGTGGYSLFEDLFIGDCVTVTKNSITTTYVIMDFDYYYNVGSSKITTVHHAVFMPATSLNLSGYINASILINTANAGVTVTNQETTNAFKWNATMDKPNTNTTAGGYIGSRMRTIIMPLCDTMVDAAFGSSHVLTQEVEYPNAFVENSGVTTGWAWNGGSGENFALLKCDLPNETQIYGAQVWSYSDNGKPAYEVGVDKRQFAYFRLNPTGLTGRSSWWLRSVASATNAATVPSSGSAFSSSSSYVFGIRPRFLVS